MYAPTPQIGFPDEWRFLSVVSYSGDSLTMDAANTTKFTPDRLEIWQTISRDLSPGTLPLTYIVFSRRSYNERNEPYYVFGRYTQVQ